MAKSTAMVSSSKGKEKATIGSTNSFTDVNPWLYKEFHLAKQVQLKEYLQADDMYSDMQRLIALYTGVMQVANTWKQVQYHDRTKCALPKHPAVIQILDRVPEITIDSTIKDVNPWAKQLTTDKIRSVGLLVEMLLGHKPQYECMQQVRNSIKDGLSQLKSAHTAWDHKLQRLLDFSTSSSTLSHKPLTLEYQEKNIKNMIHVIRVLKRMLLQENDILVNYFELMPDPPALLYALRMEEAKLPRFYPTLGSPFLPSPISAFCGLCQWMSIHRWPSLFDLLLTERKQNFPFCIGDIFQPYGMTLKL
ncbi:hypothetical protein L7F22_042941 [Adiantum nelumboides]|nr:hypothetical protein [Adiantum nelumboides]